MAPLPSLISSSSLSHFLIFLLFSPPSFLYSHLYYQSQISITLVSFSSLFFLFIFSSFPPLLPSSPPFRPFLPPFRLPHSSPSSTFTLPSLPSPSLPLVPLPVSLLAWRSEASSWWWWWRRNKRWWWWWRYLNPNV